MEDSEYMKMALDLAALSASEGEVPVGAVLVWDTGEVVGTGRNRREKEKSALCHAEMEAISKACHRLHGWRLHKATLYVTLEPCPMCAGAILNARISKVVFGAFDKKAGAFSSVLNMNDFPFNHKVELVAGFMEEESSLLLSEFFKNLRARRKEEKGKEKNGFPLPKEEQPFSSTDFPLQTEERLFSSTDFFVETEEVPPLPSNLQNIQFPFEK